MAEFPFSSTSQPVSATDSLVKKHGHKLLISTIFLAVFAIVISVFAAWAFVNYLNQKSNVDSKIAVAKVDAEKAQADSDAVTWAKMEKEPNREFAGPEDYGSLSFSYPKTWSVYVNKDASNGGDYEAYLNPISVPTVSASQQFALRVLVQGSDYDKIVASYGALVTKGDLHSSSVTVNGAKGTRLDGNFTKDIRGSAVIFKIRDKTLTIRTDAMTFKTDFDALIQTIKFNQ